MQVKEKLVLGSTLVALALGCYLGGSAKSVDEPSRTPPYGALIFAPNTVADIAEKTAPCVVNIEVDQEVAAAPFFNMPQGFQMPGMQFFFNGQPVNPGQNGKGQAGPKMEAHNSGSGFVIRPDGYILTNAHVVRDANVIKVTMNDKRTFTGKVVGMDTFSDVAVVKVDAKDLPAVTLGKSDNLRPGEFAIAIGNPIGLDHTVTLGIISGVNRQGIDVNGNINFIQTDAAINPGNSGGPLLNLQGEVIGVNTAMKANAQNIGFSIPINVAVGVANDLIAHKPIVRPWLGIQMKELDETTAKSLGITGNTKGVLIGGVFDGSPAQASGLLRGDVILKIDGKDMLKPELVRDYVRGHKVSDTLNFFVLRNNNPIAVAVNIGKYPDQIAQDLKSKNGPDSDKEDSDKATDKTAKD